MQNGSAFRTRLIIGCSVTILGFHSHLSLNNGIISEKGRNNKQRNFKFRNFVSEGAHSILLHSIHQSRTRSVFPPSCLLHASPRNEKSNKVRRHVTQTVSF